MAEKNPRGGYTHTHTHTHTHTSHIIFIYSSVDKQVSCFHVLSIVNNSAVQKGLEIFFPRSSYFDFLWPFTQK